MRSGFQADDGYMMVEDELLATAQLYTKHLHHAEYVRLKQESWKRNGNATDNISRPTDSITAMRAETQKKKDAEARAKRLHKNMEAILGDDSKEKQKGNQQGSEESDLDLDAGDEPWQGTHLHRFLSESPRKSTKTLIGLHNLQSYTKAAAGFARPEKKRVGKENTVTSSLKEHPSKTHDAVVNDERAGDDYDDDDLDKPVQINLHTSESRPVATHASHNPNNPSKQPVGPFSDSTTQKSKVKRSFLDLNPLPKASLPTVSQHQTQRQPTQPPTNTQTHPYKPDLKPILDSEISADRPSSLSKTDLIRQRLKERRIRMEKHNADADVDVERAIKDPSARCKIETEEKRKLRGVSTIDEIPLFLG